MIQVLGIGYRLIAWDLNEKAGVGKKMTHTGTVTWMQRFGGAELQRIGR
ncbi:MAG: hypothetical protein K8I04_09665 [Gammaproteobacteria bacterium]|nr:hypothetical protein [Gammaproteobacteria bacterium]MCK9506108.1 hypothetical protein [Porticoccaceae bacterium]